MLRLVPTQAPSPRQAVVARVKAAPNPDGQWQCPRCGCRTSLTTESGTTTRNGRKRIGTVINKDVCAACWRQDITSPMRPALAALVK